MSIYQRDPNAAPDSDFEPGDHRHLVVGNHGRLLDARRTPVSVAKLTLGSGTFVVRIEGYEDAGALWVEELENIRHFQFARGGKIASAEVVASIQAAISRFDRTVTISCADTSREKTKTGLAAETLAAADWLTEHSAFFRDSGVFPSRETREGAPLLQRDLTDYMRSRDLADMEEAFARQFVSNPHSGDLVKGHRMVIAEMGLVAYEGKVARDPEIFDGACSRERRGLHVLARLGFVRAFFGKSGRQRIVLYRGTSTEEPLSSPTTRNRTFVSATFNLDVAQNHFDAADGEATRVLLSQAVPVDRIFMTYLETAAMNEAFKEAEAVLLFDPDNHAF